MFSVDIDIPLELLGGISAKHFMQNYWQKKPLLIKSCIGNYKPSLSKNQLFNLAMRDDITARLISHEANKNIWQVKTSPLKHIPKDTKKPWTILVSNVNDYFDDINQFLQQFSFIPYARLDDVMVSYATDGGGVGAHFDSYDVFLFQAKGQRKWQISNQEDLTLIEDAPLKLLKNFLPQQEFILEEGDMLYLPPQYAHNGIAIGECMTYSVGFRAPILKDLIFEYFMDLIAELENYDLPTSIYADPQQNATTKSGLIPSNLAMFLQNSLNELILPNASSMLGCYLTRANSDILPLDKNMLISFDKFKQLKILSLALASKALYDDEYFYINGEKSYCKKQDIELLQELADKRCLNLASNNSGIKNNLDLMQELYEWYEMGWISIAKS